MGSNYDTPGQIGNAARRRAGWSAIVSPVLRRVQRYAKASVGGRWGHTGRDLSTQRFTGRSATPADLNGPGLRSPAPTGPAAGAANIAILTGSAARSAGTASCSGSSTRIRPASVILAGWCCHWHSRDAVDEIRRIGDEGIVTDADGLQPSGEPGDRGRLSCSTPSAGSENRTPPLCWTSLSLATPALPGPPTAAPRPSVGREFADQLRTIDHAEGIRDTCRPAQRIGRSGQPAARRHQDRPMDARLRKVKDEYCAVVRTRVDWPGHPLRQDPRRASTPPTGTTTTGFFCGMASQG